MNDGSSRPLLIAHVVRLRVVVGLVLTLVVCVGAAQVEVPEVAAGRLQQADRYRGAGDHESAIRAYQEVIELAPNLPQAYLGLGASQHALGQSENALESFARGVELQPDDINLGYALAAAQIAVDRHGDAVETLRRTIAVDDSVARLHSLLGGALRRMGRHDEALQALEDARRIDPRDKNIHYSLGLVHHALGNKPSAIASFREAVDLDSDFIQARFNLGSLLFESGQLDAARDVYEVGLESIAGDVDEGRPVSPVFAQAFANLGAIYLGREEYEKAREAYGRAARLNDGSASYHYNLGYTFHELGEIEDAARAYERALELDDVLPLAYLHLGEMYSLQRRHHDAVDILTEGMDYLRESDRAAAFRLLGQSFDALGDPHAAEGAYQDLLAADPTDSDAALSLASLLQASNRNQQAERVLEQALASARDDRVALALVDMAVDRGDIRAERQRYRSALTGHEDDPNWWSVKANLGLTSLIVSDLEAAVDWLELARADETESSETERHGVNVLLGAAYAGLGRWDQSLEVLEGLPSSTGSELRSLTLALSSNTADDLQRAADLHPSDEALDQARIGILQTAVGEWRAALSRLRSGADRWPNWTALQWALSLAAAEAGDLELATAALERANRTCARPQNPPPSDRVTVRLRRAAFDCAAMQRRLSHLLLDQARAALDAGQPDAASQLAGRVRPFGNGEQLAMADHLDGLARLAAGDSSQGGRLLEQAIAGGLPERTLAEARFHRAVSQMDSGRVNEAIAGFEALVDDPEFGAYAALNIAVTLDRADGSPERAVAWYERHVAHAPMADPAVRRRLAFLRKAFP